MRTVVINHNRQVGESARVPTWPKSAVRIGFGLIWLVDAAFKFSPDFRTGILGMVKDSSAGQPSLLHGWFHFWISAVQSHPFVWAYAIAGLETLIGLALVFGFARKVTYIVTIFSALFIWGIAEGFGGPYSATSTDIGAAVMYAVVALTLLVLSLQCGPSRYVQRRLLDRAACELVALGRRVRRALAPRPRRAGGRSARPGCALGCESARDHKAGRAGRSPKRVLARDGSVRHQRRLGLRDSGSVRHQRRLALRDSGSVNDQRRLALSDDVSRTLSIRREAFKIGGPGATPGPLRARPRVAPRWSARWGHAALPGCHSAARRPTRRQQGTNSASSLPSISLRWPETRCWRGGGKTAQVMVETCSRRADLGGVAPEVVITLGARRRRLDDELGVVRLQREAGGSMAGVVDDAFGCPPAAAIAAPRRSRWPARGTIVTVPLTGSSGKPCSTERERRGDLLVVFTLLVAAGDALVYGGVQVGRIDASGSAPLL